MTEPVPDPALPPWIVFSKLSPDEPANQGAVEAYIALAWLPYWRSLTRDEKDPYLDECEAAPIWRAAVAERYDWPPEEMAREADESEVYATTSPAPHRHWWHFWH